MFRCNKLHFPHDNSYKNASKCNKKDIMILMDINVSKNDMIYSINIFIDTMKRQFLQNNKYHRLFIITRFTSFTNIYTQNFFFSSSLYCDSSNTRSTSFCVCNGCPKITRDKLLFPDEWYILCIV